MSVDTPNYSLPITEENIRKRFTYIPPKPGQPQRYTQLRSTVLLFALEINETCPESREKSTALSKLEEAVMWANAAIARGE